MELRTSSFQDGGVIPDAYAFAVPHPETKVTFSENRNPHFEWSGVPEGTRSFAMICHDPDVPSRGDDVNQEDREVPSELPRVDFFHWVAVNLPPDLREIPEGEFSEGVGAGGKEGMSGPYDCLHGINDYTGWFSGDADMAGDYYGYDGPAPPWNDSLIHRYVFTLYALDVESIDLPEKANGHDARSALDGHVLAEASVMGTYTLNPRLRT